MKDGAQLFKMVSSSQGVFPTLSKWLIERKVKRKINHPDGPEMFLSRSPGVGVELAEDPPQEIEHTLRGGDDVERWGHSGPVLEATHPQFARANFHSISACSCGS
ncbi:hypothetical protein TNIN_81001 [Trichonephila inaurata madagascariensis]|uniref:Uncharacterized protein n=1 Tax=Trichonephila inaurata madagascariensis TaxID=2747483 RepID=A0A8X6X7R8_9ARAC|nr:hypothetical protein TNIN_81001 [Trichonephila inaurata madagascariensis]